MEGQLGLYDEIGNCMDKYDQEVPSSKFSRNAIDGIFKDGALSHKVKRLMALAIALQSGCTTCIIGQTKNAVNLGATKDEVMEAISVAFIMGGITTTTQRWRVFKVLEELGNY